MMELELGLALPNQRRKGLDLNSSYGNGAMEIERNYKGCGGCNSGFVDDDDEVESKDLSLLLWSGQPNEEDDRSGSEKWRNDEMNDDESQELVGWPPINSLRKELLHHNHGGRMAANHRGAVEAEVEEGGVAAVRNSMYVKVKMEGVPIGRKIDLRNYDSYQALTNALIDMFAKYTRNDRDGDHTILYQDREGDWMLAGDVPWESFVESVRRMMIIRNDK